MQRLKDARGIVPRHAPRAWNRPRHAVRQLRRRFRGVQLGELLPQTVSGAGNPALHRPDIDADNGTDFRIRAVQRVAEVQDFAILWPEPGDAALDQAVELRQFELLEWIGLVADQPVLEGRHPVRIARSVQG